MLARTPVFALIALGTVIGLAGIDLVLPAVPGLPDALGGDATTAQYVLAAFAAGTGLGLLVFGELGARFRTSTLLSVSLLCYGLLSLLATFATGLIELSIARFFQGLAAAGPAVFAPVMIKAMYDEAASIAALGRMGSIEAMTPALAPILGAWLLRHFDWRASFYLTAALAGVLSLIWLCAHRTRSYFGHATRAGGEGYRGLLGNRTFLRHAMSQALTLGSLLIIVFAAPAVITRTMGGTLADFITMQIIGITCFAVAANTSHHMVSRVGESRTVFAGTAMTLVGCVLTLFVGLLPESPIPGLWASFVFVNTGLGVRGPAGFSRALVAAGDDPSRGSAVTVLLVMLTAAVGTAAVAPYVDRGLPGVAALSSVVAAAALWLSLPSMDLATNPTGGSRD